MNTPRSLEACKRQGITPQELVFQSQADFKKSLGVEANSLHKDQITMRWNHLEQRRKEKLKVIKEERELVVIEENNGHWVPPTSSQMSAGSSPSKAGLSTQMGGMRHSIGSPSKLQGSRTAVSGFTAKTSAPDSALIDKER